jgi:hypothetical protein
MSGTFSDDSTYTPDELEAIADRLTRRLQYAEMSPQTRAATTVACNLCGIAAQLLDRGLDSETPIQLRSNAQMLRDSVEQFADYLTG